jgi:hypothetical protein
MFDKSLAKRKDMQASADLLRTFNRASFQRRSSCPRLFGWRRKQRYSKTILNFCLNLSTKSLIKEARKLISGYRALSDMDFPSPLITILLPHPSFPLLFAFSP